MNEKRKQAIYELDDELFKVKRNIVNAGYIMQDISEDFFEKYDPEKQEDMYAICYEFNRYAAKVSILQDILINIETVIKSLGITL